MLAARVTECKSEWLHQYSLTFVNTAMLLYRFTGKIRLAKDLIKDLYIHMGYQKPTAFKTILDITLKDGRVVEINDRSREMEEKRGAF
jgi:hypothetical protein